MAGDPLHGLPHVEDPCEAIIDALLVFLKWFMLVRRMELADSETAELATRGIAMMEKLKEVFPEKSGEAQGSVSRIIRRSKGLEFQEDP